MPRIPLITPGLQSFLPKNMFFVAETEYGPPAMIGTPGMKVWLDLSDSINAPVRATRVVKGLAYALIGNTFYLINEDATETSQGTVTTDSGEAVIIDNGSEIMITILGVNSYNYDIGTGTLSLITDAALPIFSSLTYQDGYALGVIQDTDQFAMNETAFDFTTWNALDVGEAFRLPDNLRSGLILDGEYWAFGSGSIEAFQNTGAAAFPWEKIEGVDHTVGCSAALAPTVIDNNIYFPDDKDQVRRTQGYSTQIISTEGIEKTISGFDTVSDAKGFNVKMRSNWWYVLVYPSENRSLIYDVTASARLQGNVWYEWESFPFNGRHRINNFIYFGRKYLIGDFEKAIIWELDFDTLDDNGEELHSEYTTPWIDDDGDFDEWGQAQVLMKTGVGLLKSQVPLRPV